MVKIYFEQGTLLIQDLDEIAEGLIREWLVYDERQECWRAQGFHYANIVLALHRAKVEYQDSAKAFSRVQFKAVNPWTPRDYQAKALEAWWQNRGRGVVVLPTGAGKSFLANLCILKVNRPTLVVVPTIDLMHQWNDNLEKYFGEVIGMLGGGCKDIDRNIVVSTYDSAVIHLERIGNRFGFIIFDECHHLPSAVSKTAALMSIAPYRLGLTATPERTDDGEQLLYQLLGDLVFRIEIDELEHKVLAPYTTTCFTCDLNESEREAYDYHRKIYTDFLKSSRIDFSRDGWSQFIIQASRQAGGKQALKSFMEQKKLARTCQSKFDKIWELIVQHAGERILIFTADNATAYALGESLMMPVITHHTKGKERKQFLDRFRSGEYLVLITSRVLNEGVDVPEASVGIVVSGSGSTREHVQRLGRILRASAGKQANLYELISEGTAEVFVSERRRQHRAYQR